MLSSFLLQTMPSVANASLKHPCPICKSKFSSRNVLKAHTGSTSPGSASAHPCSLCDRQFCSMTALQSHQNAPSHNTMFKCEECEKSFRGKEALKDHQKAKEHRNNRPLLGSVVTTLSYSMSSEQLGYQRRSWGTVAERTHGSKLNGLIGQMMNFQLDEDWALCDKDCGWCGHCA